MAILKKGNLSFCIDFHSLDGCGDIVYAYRFLCNGINIINPQLLKDDMDWCKDGIFLTTECSFDDSGIIDFFKRVIETKDGGGYESAEPPIIYIDCEAWNDFKVRRIEIWKNSRGIDGHRHYSDESIENDKSGYYEPDDFYLHNNYDSLSTDEKAKEIAKYLKWNTSHWDGMPLSGFRSAIIENYLKGE